MRQSRPSRTVLGLAAVALVAPAALLAPSPATAVVTECSGRPQDINGDGFGDIAVGESSGGPDRAGRLHVFYGTATGPATAATGDALDDQVFGQGTGGLSGAGTAGDAFGATVVLEDFNGDGCADVAVSAPGDESGSGTVWVLYGSITGLSTAGATALSENVIGFPGRDTDEQFGSSLAAGDFNGDDIADLAVGAPFEIAFEGEPGRQGAVGVFYGSAGGIVTSQGESRLLDQSRSGGIGGTAEDGDGFGLALAAGDVTGDGIDDLAVGVPGENRAAGIVQVVPGTTEFGLTGIGTKTWSENTPGTAGVPEVEDNFGFAVGIGDVDGDGGGDLVVGSPGENASRGAVTAFFSNGTGPIAGTGAQTRTQNSTGVDGVPAAGDFFGWVLAVGPLDGDAFADVAVGTPNDAVGQVPLAGSVTTLRGSASGLSTAGYGGARITQQTTGIPGSPEREDSFGFMVAISPVQGLAAQNLLVGVPAENLGTLKDAGDLLYVPATSTGPGTAGSRGLNADTPGVTGVARANAFWGLSID